jgi:hypothetical protein
LNWPGNRAWKARIKLGRCLAAPCLSKRLGATYEWRVWMYFHS